LIYVCLRANIQSPKGKHTPHTEGKHHEEAELHRNRSIEERITELEEEYELDTYDIQEIRDEEYRLGGWSYDPFPEIEEEEEEEEEEWHYRSLEQQLNEVGMSMRDFL